MSQQEAIVYIEEKEGERTGRIFCKFERAKRAIENDTGTELLQIDDLTWISGDHTLEKNEVIM